MSRVPVTFLPQGQVGWIVPGATVLQAARAAGVPIPAPCGARGVCGGCAVRVVDGELEAPQDDEARGLARAPEGVRLACLARVAACPVSVRPLVPFPRADAVGVAPVDEFSVAIDLGTTNVVAAAIECATGREVGRALVPNRQRAWGADVLSRLSAARAGEAAGLQRAAIESLAEAIDSCTGGHRHDAAAVVIAGNSVMAGLLSGVDVSGLATAPFAAPRISEEPEGLAEQLGLKAGARVKVLQPLAAFAGGDLRAGVIALGFARGPRPGLLLDVGTNAEVALWTGARLVVSSAPAGPAFEGVGLSCAGPAVEGAGVAVTLDGGSIRIDVLGDGPARWLSGSGLLTALASLREAGHLDADGRMLREGPLGDRFSIAEDGVARIDLGTPAAPLELTQLDVRELQLAKAAIRVAVEGVMRAGGVSAAGLDVLHVAGAFGNAVPASVLADLGIVPAGSSGSVRPAGNTALAGAAMIACPPPGPGAPALETESGADHVDLATDPGFSARLMDATRLEPYDV